MSDTPSTDIVILKILNGTQSGAEVSLIAGEYSLGTGADDDIQLIDVSIKPGHARLRVSTGKIELKGADGSLRTATGLQLEANGAWQEIEPLDVVTAGTTRLALGHATSRWATIAEDRGEAPPNPAVQPASAGGRAQAVLGQLRTLAVPLAALALLLVFAVWFLLGGGLSQIAARLDRNRDDLALTREALDQFPFGRRVAVHQEVDGTVYVSGYVDTPVERRALSGAIEKTAVPARIRLWVLQNIRSEVESLIAAQKVPVTFKLSPDGRLTLDGVILNEERAARFVELVRDRVVGLADVTSQIRTSATLLGDVERLAVVAQVQPFILLRATNDMIEATGAIPAEKVDAYIGFLQSYARRFARDIPLRSFVQLQGGSGSGPIVVGGGAGGNEFALDLDRLTQGGYRPRDLFPGSGASQAADVASRTRDGADSRPSASASATAMALAAQRARAAASAREAAARAEAEKTAQDTLLARARAPAGGALTDQARRLIDRWRDGNVGSDALRNALEALRGLDPTAGSGAVLPSWYLPLPSGGTEEADACWPDTQIRPRDVLAALFWLDLLSLNDALSLAELGRDLQPLLLEVALSPARATACARRSETTAPAAANSVYLREIGRNPSFVRFIVRSLPPFTIEITGANLMQPRFILTRDGRRMFEGSAPDQASRVAAIGELGLAIQLKTGVAAVIFEPDLSWKITQ